MWSSCGTVRDPSSFHHCALEQLFQVSPSGFEGEASGVTSVAPQRTERPGDQLGARVVDVPQVNVLVCDLHHTFPINVQVGTWKEEHVETL